MAGIPTIPRWWPDQTRRFMAEQYRLKVARQKRMPKPMGGRPVGDTLGQNASHSFQSVLARRRAGPPKSP